METEQSKSGIQIGAKSFITSAIILFILMMLSGVLTAVVPSGSFERTMESGREMIIADSFQFAEKVSYPFYRWLIAPVEVLFSPESATVIVIMAFILCVGGTFSVLDKSGMLTYIMGGLVRRYAGDKYKLMAVLVLLFMVFGSTLGMFEEIAALVPISIALAYSLGWDSFVGLGMSIMSASFGFAAATLNPFTLGIAQKLSGLPVFSGLPLRICIFIIIYTVLLTFLMRYAKKIEKNPALSKVYEEDSKQRGRYSQETLTKPLPNEQHLKKASRVFGGFLLFTLGMIITGFFVPVVSELSLPLIAVLFLIGGVCAAKAARYGNTVGKDFLQGILGIAPGCVLILMAVSVKLIITNGGIIDTMLYYAADKISVMNPYMAAIMMYLLIFVMDFFIGSGSAKVFLVIPILAPLAEMIGVTRQVTVQAYCFGDGFCNLLFPTNPVLMIALGLTVVSYPKWLRWSIGIQLGIFIVSCLILIVAVAIGYGPF